MSLLSASELAAVQSVVESGMTTTVAIYHGSSVKDDNGQSWVYPASPNATTIGWLYNLTGPQARVGVIDGQMAVAETHRLFLPIGTDCRPSDKVVIDGSTYIVQSNDTSDTYPASLTVYLRIQN